jgi:hypothetical protein
MSSFEYRFIAEPAGTFWYHSHMPYQFGDGVFGAFIVKDPENDPYVDAVEDEIAIGLSEWSQYHSDMVYQYVSQFRFDYWPLAHYISFLNGQQEFSMTLIPGATYRFRIYCATVEYGYRLFFQGHTMTVIAADGSLVQPTTTDYLDVFSGERYDVLVTADQEVGIYLLLANVLNFLGELVEDAVLYGVFTYEGALDNNATNATLVISEQLAAFNSSNASLTLLDQYDLVAYKDESSGEFAAGYQTLPGPAEVLADPWVYTTTSYAVVGERQYQFMDSWDNYFSSNPSEPLMFLDDTGLKMDMEKEARALTVAAYIDANQTHSAILGPRFQFLDLDQVIDVVFQNAATPGNELGFFVGAHPMHIHGHYFWSLGSGEGAFDADVANESVNFVDPPLRDNIVVKANSWVLLRFQASNPGLWLMHCHLETHAVFGMKTTLVVGTAEERPALPDTFPVCGVVPSSGSSEGDPATETSDDSKDGPSPSAATTFEVGVFCTFVLLVQILLH